MKSRSFKRYFILLYPFLMLLVLASLALISGISFSEITAAAAKPFISSFYRLAFLKELIILSMLSLAMMLSLSMGEMNFSLEGVFHTGIFLFAIAAIYLKNFLLLSIFIIAIIIYITWQVPHKISRGDRSKLIISSLIFNYVILGVINYLVYTFFSDEKISSAVTKSFDFSLSLFWGYVISMFTAVLFIYLVKKFKIIDKLKIIKDAPLIIKSMGGDIKKERSGINALISLLTTVAAFLYLFLNYNRFSLQGFTGYGFDAITVAILARSDFKKVLLPSILITYIRLFTLIMQTEFSFISSIMYLMQGLLIFISILEANHDRSI